jgi:hypothetical protein
VCQIKRELTKIQILLQNASNLFEGQEKVPAVTKRIRFMAVEVDLVLVQTDSALLVAAVWKSRLLCSQTVRVMC